MESDRTPKCLLNGELFGVRRRVRPRKRWFRDVKDGLRRMRVGKWKEKAQRRYTWRLTVKEAKDHQGIAEKEEEEEEVSPNTDLLVL
jgi:hypothetical protein